MENKIKDITRQVRAWGQTLAERKGARDQIEKNLTQEKDSLAEMSSEQQSYKQAYTFLMSELSERRAMAIKNIEATTTSGLKMVYDDGYSLVFDTFDEKRSEDGAASYKMEMRVNGIIDGQERSFILQGGKGGGLHDNIALILRDSALMWKNYQGFMMMDETWKFLSRDDKIENAALLLRQISDLNDRQYIFATHMLDEFAPVADNIVRFIKEDGVVSCEYLSPHDIVEIEEEYGQQEEDE